jgi:hypothetical protein
MVENDRCRASAAGMGASGRLDGAMNPGPGWQIEDEAGANIG